MAGEEKLIFPMHLDLDVTDFSADWAKVEPELQAIIDAKPIYAKINIDDAALKAAVSNLSKLQAGGIKPGSPADARMMIANEKAKAVALAATTKAINANAIATDKGRIAAANAEKAEIALERAKQRGISAVNTQNKMYQAQRGVLNGLSQMAMNYVSVMGAFNLGQNIIKVTAEFEMQKVALGAIIQNKQAADKLFSQDVELGLKSPFQIMDLVKYTKELAGFRIETDQLFETTKRLADVSAGVGTDMSQIVLAYGQVKAGTVLNGKELRQFTYAGIPMLQMLADRFTILQGKAVSTGDVFKMVTQRLIKFGDVKAVFEAMTNAGGVFFNMQEIQSRTLKGSLSNLVDAYQKMFMEVGNANMAPLKSTVDGMKDLMANWETVGNVITTAGVAYGVSKLSMMAYNTVLGESNARMLESIGSDNAKQASLLRVQSRYMALNDVESARITLGKSITGAQISELMSTDKLSKASALRLVYLGKTTEAQRAAMVTTGKVAESEVALAMGKRLTNAQSLVYNQSLGSLITARGTEKLSLWELNTAEIQQFKTRTLLLAQTGTLSAGNRENAISIGLVTEAELVGAASTKAYSGAFGGLMRGAAIATAGIKAFAASIWATVTAMAPMAIAMAAIYGGYELVMSLTSAERERKKQIEETAKAALSYTTELKEAYNSVKNIVESGLSSGADNKAIFSARAALQQIIEKNETLIPLVAERLKNLTTEAARLAEIKKIWDEINSSVKDGGKYTPAIANANAGTKNAFGKGGAFAIGGDFTSMINELDANMGYIQSKFGIITSDLQTNLKAHEEAFTSGVEDINKYKDALEHLESITKYRALAAPKGSEARTEYGYLVVNIGDAIKKASELQTKTDDFVSHFKNSVQTIGEGANKQTIDWAKSNKGLTINNYNLLKTSIIESEQLFLKTTKEEEKAGVTMAFNISNALLGIKLPTIMPKKDISNFGKLYNSWITKYNLKGIKTITDSADDQSITDLSAGDANSKQLKEDIETLRKYNLEVLAGNNYSKDAIPALKEKIASEKILNTLLGGDKAPKGVDTRIAAYADQLKVVRDAYAKYLELRKLIGDEAAKQQVKGMFQDSIVNVKGTQTLSLAFTPENMNKNFAVAETNMVALEKTVGAKSRDILKEQSDFTFSELTRTVTENLDKLSSDIEQTQKANEFYEKMLGLDMTPELARKITASMGMKVGSVREEIQKAMAEEMKVKNASGEVIKDYGLGVDMNNISSVQGAVNGMRGAGMENQPAALQKLLNQQIDYDTKVITEYADFKKKIADMQLEAPFLGTGAMFDISKLSSDLSAKIASEDKLHEKILANYRERHRTDINYTDEEFLADIAAADNAFDNSLGNEKALAQEKLKNIAKTYVDDKLQSAGLGKDATSNLSTKSLSQLNDNLARLKKLQGEIKAGGVGILPPDIQAQLSAAGLSLDDFIKEVEELFGLEFSDNLNQKTEDLKKAAKEILTSLGQVGSEIEKLGKVSGNTGLEGLGQAVSQITSLVSTVSEDIASDNPLKAGLDVVMAIGTAIIDDIAHTEELKNKLKEVQLQLQKQAIEDLISNKDGSSLFGTNYWDNVSSQVDAINLAKKKFDDTIKNTKNSSLDLGNGIGKSYYNSVSDFTFKSDNKSGFMNFLGFADGASTLATAAKKLGVELYGADGALNPTSLKAIYDQYSSEMDATQKRWFENAIAYSEEYQKAMKALDDSITEMFGQIASGLADEFMKSYGSIVDTANGIDEVFKNLGNSITKSLVQSFIIEEYLDPLKKSIKDIYNDTTLSSEQKGAAIAGVIATWSVELKTLGVPAVDAILKGMSDSGLYTPTNSKLTGISGAVSSMSEAEANTMGGYLNSGLMQWVQQTVLQTNILAQGSEIKTSIADMFALQQQSLATINSIKSDTEKIVLSLGYILGNQRDSMIQGGTKAINVRLLN